MRQQMDESNHEMVNMLTHQMTTVLNPIVEMTNTSYQILAEQMRRIADVFGAPRVPIRQGQNVAQTPNQDATNLGRNGQIFEQNRPNFGPNLPRQNEGNFQGNQPFIIARNQNADEILEQVRQNNLGGHQIQYPNNPNPQNIANVVEQVLNQHGFDVGYANRPYFVSAFSEAILQAELPRGWKVPKFTKFAGDSGESTVEHIARYAIECGDLARNEDLKLKYFPSSLTKGAFTWFTTLPPNSIHNWNQLERRFHEQFFRGEAKVSLMDLVNIKRIHNESIDNYLSRFRQMRSRCFTQIPEYELVQVAIGGLEYSIRKKLINQQLRDMSQLATRVRQIEQLKAEKFVPKKIEKFPRKDKVAYIGLAEGEIGSENDLDEEDVDLGVNEVNVAELKPGPPYVCQSLKPLKIKDKTRPNKSYAFDVSKADHIFDILLKDGQIILSDDHKIPTLEQRKGQKYCKFRHVYGHWTNNCVCFKDLIQDAIK
ncbi:uncharacterized protein LOC113851132 [Abrus precatorius]|uniref:Uncharacterized protein LOC113851132 n=1 Tax=Abrus precatorius TaxID=3816 RepID=A0A8B8K311_ABRPR|nr:uncharacterized protein LOC113851132 [Abrus precatorius]